MKNNYNIKEIVNKVREHISSHFIPQSETTETKLKMFQDSLAYDHTLIEKNMNEFGTLDKVNKTYILKPILQQILFLLIEKNLEKL